jgi:hypothetical protein
MNEKHEHHEDEVKLPRGQRLSGQPESDTPAPQKQEWPEEVDAGGKKTGGALENDPGMKGRVGAEKKAGWQDRPGEEASAEAKTARGIDAQAADPGRVGGPMDGGGRQPVEAPTEKLDKVSSYEGSLSHDREGREGPDMVEKGTERGGNAGPTETSGTKGRDSGNRKGHLKVDEGAGGEMRT